MADLTFGGQAPPPTLPGFDLENLIAQIEAKFKTKPEIQTNAIYDRNEVIVLTGFSLSTLIRAEEKGKLRGRYEGRRRYYLGRDLLAWLAGEGNCEVCGDQLADSMSPTATPTGIRCATCANYRK